ncbi:FliH/SctL family protein [Rheinheimera hassiensis]|uniref:FliH/SctL family protein n=1 Tax=Rheinheimera hassiensis TaxID=1193627 RepID=UPI001F0632E9|nr:FliH/SctL family protein [Rheinheimera hassiensis]
MADLYRFPGVQRDLSRQSPEQQLQQAYERGVQEGRLQGAEQGRLQAQQQAEQQALQQADARQQQAIQQLRQQFEQQLQKLQQQLQQQQQHQEKQLAQAIFELVSQLTTLTLEAELSLQPAHLQQAIASVLALLQVNEQIDTIRLAPTDFTLWQQLDIVTLGNIKLQPDARLVAGSAEFVGLSQLHLLDFRQRLAQMLPQLKQQLESNNEPA